MDCQIDHAVTLVGYDLDDGYWILRNSWGQGAGGRWGLVGGCGCVLRNSWGAWAARYRGSLSVGRRGGYWILHNSLGQGAGLWVVVGGLGLMCGWRRGLGFGVGVGGGGGNRHGIYWLLRNSWARCASYTLRCAAMDRRAGVGSLPVAIGNALPVLV